MLLSPLPLLIQSLLSGLVLSSNATVAYLKEENRVLREQLGGKRPHFTDAQRMRLARCARRLRRSDLLDLGPLVTPDTLMRWYRRLVALKYNSSKLRRAGRPKRSHEIEARAIEIALSNPSWGYTRIRGALSNLGFEVGRSTIGRILGENGIHPAPTRGKTPSWAEFLRSYRGSVAATDFFAVEVLTPVGLVRTMVLFFIDLKSRRVEIGGIRRDPHGRWMQQIGRNLTDPRSGFLRRMRLLIHDRDPLFTRDFRQLMRDSGVEPLRLPAKSPNLNAYAERFVRSIRQECLNRTIPLGERHLRKLVHEYAAHYNTERNHQGIGNRLIEEPRGGLPRDGPIRCRKRLGGMLKYYYREAA